MKALALTVLLMALSGCANGHFFPKGHGYESDFKCQMNPYDPVCLEIRKVYHN
ncbi:hypothetical protein SAMN05216205_3502 [Pseudomonas mohnii]|uniref:Lipoprotein n=1 Tax=Pseudomonas mohnii TaxID=395600 RepID=A0ABY0Y3H2_9PSED|nr:hypothetical protein SAMN05216205_3502 [Pseudomonas mohnii]